MSNNTDLLSSRASRTDDLLAENCLLRKVLGRIVGIMDYNAPQSFDEKDNINDALRDARVLLKS